MLRNTHIDHNKNNSIFFSGCGRDCNLVDSTSNWDCYSPCIQYVSPDEVAQTSSGLNPRVSSLQLELPGGSLSV